MHAMKSPEGIARGLKSRVFMEKKFRNLKNKYIDINCFPLIFATDCIPNKSAKYLLLLQNKSSKWRPIQMKTFQEGIRRHHST